MDLHAAIMNIRANARHIDDVPSKHAYLDGHRDARHAAAELAASHAAEVEALRSALQEILRVHSNDNHRPMAFYIAADALKGESK